MRPLFLLVAIASCAGDSTATFAQCEKAIVTDTEVTCGEHHDMRVDVAMDGSVIVCCECRE